MKQHSQQQFDGGDSASSPQGITLGKASPEVNPYMFAAAQEQDGWPKPVRRTIGPYTYIRDAPIADPANEGWLLVKHRIEVNISFLDESDEEVDLEEVAEDVARNLRGLNGNGLSDEYPRDEDPNSEKVRVQYEVAPHITIRDSMADVPANELLVVFVDYVYDNDGGSWGGVAPLRGMIAYVASYNKEMEFIKDTATHEIGHLFGFQHSWEDDLEDTGPEGIENMRNSENFMSYKADNSVFSSSQRHIFYDNAFSGELGNGANRQAAPKSTYKWWSNATNLEPYDDNVSEGDIIPLIVRTDGEDMHLHFSPLEGHSNDGHGHDGHNH